MERSCDRLIEKFKVRETSNQLEFDTIPTQPPNPFFHLICRFLHINVSGYNGDTFVNVVRMMFSGFRPCSSKKHTR